MRSWRTLTRGSLAVAALAMANPAYANASCTFTITSISFDNGGTMAANFAGSGATYGLWMCNVSGSTTVNTGPSTTSVITSDHCKAIYTLFLTAKMSNKTVDMLFGGSFTTCATITPTTFPYQITLSQ